MSKPKKISPVKAKNVGRGDGIKHGIHSGRVTRWPTQPDDKVRITWERGSATGVLAINPDADVRRVYKPKSRWSW